MFHAVWLASYGSKLEPERKKSRVNDINTKVSKMDHARLTSGSFFSLKIAEKIQGLIGFSEPDEGPLSNFHTYAPDMVKLFTEGIKKSEGMLEDQIKDSFDMGDIVMDSASVNVRDIGTTSGAGAFNAGGITINLYARDGQTARDIVDEVEYRIAKNVEAKKAVWGMS